MITVANYLEKKDTIDWSKVPQKYKDVRPDVEMDIDLYDEPTAVDVRNLVDAFIDGINKSQKPVGEIIVAKVPTYNAKTGSGLKPKTTVKQFPFPDSKNFSKYDVYTRSYNSDFDLQFYSFDDGSISEIKNEKEFISRKKENGLIVKMKEAFKPAPEKKPIKKVNFVVYNEGKFITKKTLQSGYSFTDNENFAYTWDESEMKVAEQIAKGYNALVITIEEARKLNKLSEASEVNREKKYPKRPKTVAKAEPQPKGTVKIQPVVEKKFVDNFSTEFQLIKRFWNVIKDKKIVVEFRKAQLLYTAFNKAAIERKVRKTSDVAEIFNSCNQKMKVLFEEFMLPTQEDVKIDFADKDLYDKIEKYVANVSINPAVAVLKRFVAIQNTLPEIKKAETLLKTLIKTKEKFKDSRLSDELSKAIKALQDYIKNPKEPIEVKNYGLSKPKVVKKKVQPQPKVATKVKAKPKAAKGPVNIAKTVAKNPAVKVVPKKTAPKLNAPEVAAPLPQIKRLGKIVGINETGKQQNNFYKVNGSVGKFLQQVERKPFESVVITIDGMQGAGKTTTLYKFIDAFASAGNSSLFISGEEHPESALAVEKRDKYLSTEAKKHTAIVGDVDSIEQLYQYVKPYDIIFIDSWQKLQRMVGAIRLDEDLRKKFNGKVFVVIFQQTTTGRTKGGAEVVFDGDIIIKMVKEASFADNYAYFDKNRYTRIPIENIRYNIASGTVYNPNAQEEPTLQQPANYSTGFAFQI